MLDYIILCILPYSTISYYTMSYSIILTILYYILLYYIFLYYVLYHILFYYTLLYYILLYYIVLYSNVLYCIIYTVLMYWDIDAATIRDSIGGGGWISGFTAPRLVRSTDKKQRGEHRKPLRPLHPQGRCSWELAVRRG